ncbi:MAG: hypothetical protein ACKOFW_15395 [Planctomycetaceae bacterium]
MVSNDLKLRPIQPIRLHQLPERFRNNNLSAKRLCYRHVSEGRKTSSVKKEFCDLLTTSTTNGTSILFTVDRAALLASGLKNTIHHNHDCGRVENLLFRITASNARKDVKPITLQKQFVVDIDNLSYDWG